MKKIIYVLAFLIFIFIVLECNNKQPEVKPEEKPELIPTAGSEPEPERKLFNLMRIYLSFDKNLNNIDSIWADDDRVNFYSKAGAVSYRKNLDYWEIDTIPYRRLQVNDWKNISQDVPALFKRSSYLEVKDRAKKDYEVVLTWYAGEGAESFTSIFDTSRNAVYYPKFDLYKSIGYDDDKIYIGQESGFSVISRIDETIDNYAFLPFVNKESNVYISDDFIWIATDRIGIQRLNKKNNNSLIFWSCLELADLIDSAEIRNSIHDDWQVEYTNFCENDDFIAVGYRLICDNEYKVPSRYGSFLLTYDKRKHVWKSLYVPEIKALKLLAMDKNRIWLVGNHPEFGEGDSEPLCHGGVAVLDLSGWNIHYFKEIPYNHMVYDFSEEEDKLIIHTYNYNNAIYKYIIFGDVAYNISGIDSVKYQFAGAMHNEVKNQALKKSQSEYGTNLSLLKDMKIRLQIVRLNKQPVKLYKQPYHNWKPE